MSEGLLNTIAASIQNEKYATRLAALQMLGMAASDPQDGGIAAMDAIHHLSTVAKEPTRFFTLVEQLQDPGCPVDYKVAAMELISNVIKNAPDLNMLVYWQMDLERAGALDIMQKLIQPGQSPMVSKQAEQYLAKLVNVDDVAVSREESRQQLVFFFGTPSPVRYLVLKRWPDILQP